MALMEYSKLSQKNLKQLTSIFKGGLWISGSGSASGYLWVDSPTSIDGQGRNNGQFTCYIVKEGDNFFPLLACSTVSSPDWELFVLQQLPRGVGKGFQIIPQKNIVASSLFQMIEEHIEDFLAYLDINRSMFFSSRNSLTATIRKYLT